MNLLDLAVKFRVLNHYTHQAHHMVKGPSFHEDHSFFGSLYEFADDSFDRVVEESIGIDEAYPNIKEILKNTLDRLNTLDNNFYKTSLDLLKEISTDIDNMTEDEELSDENEANEYCSGTVNMLQDIADKINVFIYKIKRRNA